MPRQKMNMRMQMSVVPNFQQPPRNYSVSTNTAQPNMSLSIGNSGRSIAHHGMQVGMMDRVRSALPGCSSCGK
jgi:hypothetical protein